MNLEFVDELVPIENRALVLHFLLVFARFEYALKRAGFITENAEADWNAFSSENKAVFNKNQNPELSAACDYIIENPPLKQIQVNRELDWKESKWPEQEPVFIWLLLMVRRIRNNLFHGGKFPFAPVDDPARNKVLLDHSLVILEACVYLNPVVKKIFIED